MEIHWETLGKIHAWKRLLRPTIEFRQLLHLDMHMFYLDVLN